MFEVEPLSVANVIMVTTANNSLDSAADDNLLESETNNKGQPFFVKNSSMIRPYLGGCRTIREPKTRDNTVTQHYKRN